MKQAFFSVVLLGVIGFALGFYSFTPSASPLPLPTTEVIRQDLKVEINTVGELEAAKSRSIASSIKGDQGKIIDLVTDGIQVHPGQILIKLDPTPFEEKLEKIHIQIKEQEAYIATFEHALEWDKVQAEHKNRTAALEVESAKLERDKILYGDGPQETSRLKAIMQKARVKFEELSAYSQDLLALQDQGFLNLTEVKQVQKKLVEEQEACEIAYQQYESYVQHVLPMQIQKAETYLKRAQISQEETIKAGFYHVAKSAALLEQATQTLVDYSLQLQEAQKELLQTQIAAPASGMVVLREDYHAGQKRKPRIGDIVIKNQPLIDLPDLSSMIVKTRIREIDLFKVDIGKKATIQVDAYPQLILQGSIVSIGVLALAEGGKTNEEKSFDVRIALEASDTRLRPGMTARVSIHAQEVKNVLTIPLYSVFDDPYQTYCYVSTGEGREWEKRTVQLGICNEQWTEIQSGLREGESVCLVNPQIGIAKKD